MDNVWGYQTIINLIEINNSKLSITQIEDYFFVVQGTLDSQNELVFSATVIDLDNKILLNAFAETVSVVGHFDKILCNAYIDIISNSKYDSDKIIDEAENFFECLDGMSYCLKRPRRKIYDSVDDLMLRKPPRLFFD